MDYQNSTNHSITQVKNKSPTEKPLIIFSCYHKSGTTLLRKFLNSFCQKYDLIMKEGHFESISKKEFQKIDVWFDPWSTSQVRRNLDNKKPRNVEEEIGRKCLGVHLIRDPKNIIVSGYLYHKKQKKEKAWKGSYKQALNSLDQDDGLLFEMEHTGKETITRMKRWNYQNPIFLEIKYENLMSNFKSTFEKILSHIQAPDPAEDIKLAQAHDINLMSEKDIKNNEHIFSKKFDPYKWTKFFKDIHHAKFDSYFGDVDHLSFVDYEVLYIASSEEHQSMAKHSIKSLRKVSNLPIVFMTACPETINANEIENLEVIRIEHNSCKIKRGEPFYQNSDVWGAKISALKDRFLGTRRKTIIFVDADTRFLSDPLEIISDCYDVAACREAVFRKDKFNRVVALSVNTGFLVLNKNERTTNLIEQQQLVYEKLRLGMEARKGQDGSAEAFPCNDQKAFNLALEMDPLIRIFILSNEWNVRKPLINLIKNPKMYHLTDLDKKDNNYCCTPSQSS